MVDLQYFLFLAGATTYLSLLTPLLLEHDSVQIAYTVFPHLESILTLLLSQLNIELLILEIFFFKQNKYYVSIWLVTGYSLTLKGVWLAL